jgi:hypothetical protein
MEQPAAGDIAHEAARSRGDAGTVDLVAHKGQRLHDRDRLVRKLRLGGRAGGIGGRERQAFDVALDMLLHRLEQRVALGRAGLERPGGFPQFLQPLARHQAASSRAASGA